MPEFGGPGKTLIVLGLGIAAAGFVLALIGKSPAAGHWLGWLGRLPGDLLIKREHFTVYLPLSTGLLVSVVGSVLLYVFMKR